MQNDLLAHLLTEPGSVLCPWTHTWEAASEYSGVNGVMASKSHSVKQSTSFLWKDFPFISLASSSGEPHSLIQTWICVDLQVLQVNLPPFTVSFLLLWYCFHHIFRKRPVFHSPFPCWMYQIIEIFPWSGVTETSGATSSSWMTTGKKNGFFLSVSWIKLFLK